MVYLTPCTSQTLRAMQCDCRNDSNSSIYFNKGLQYPVFYTWWCTHIKTFAHIMPLLDDHLEEKKHHILPVQVQSTSRSCLCGTEQFYDNQTVRNGCTIKSGCEGLIHYIDLLIIPRFNICSYYSHEISEGVAIKFHQFWQSPFETLPPERWMWYKTSYEVHTYKLNTRIATSHNYES